MDNATFKTVVTVFSYALGVLVPFIIILFKVFIKYKEKKEAERDTEINNKFEKLFSICDGVRKCLTDKAIQIAKLEEAIDRLDKVAERCGK